MARIDLERRAQIGRNRRVKTRAQLVEAARALYAQRPLEAVTVDELVATAEVAKGTFYVHFDGLADLQSALADELAREFDELLQPRRLNLVDPIERVAAGCEAFVSEAIRRPAWGALVARGAMSMPEFAAVTRARVFEDIREATRSGRLDATTPELAVEFVFGLSLQALRAAGEGRLAASQTDEIVAAILRAIGVSSGDAQEISRRVVTVRLHDSI